MRSVQVTLSEVAYALRSCDYLVNELQEVERTLEHVSEVDPLRTPCWKQQQTRLPPR
jgi:hypothetical protein